MGNRADEVVLECGIERDPACLYYVKDDAVWRLESDVVGTAAPQRVLSLPFELERGYVYYVDAGGDVRRHAQARARRAAAPLPDALRRRIRVSPNHVPGKGIRTLSVRQPWAWAILHGGKDVENRSKRTSISGTVAIHAAAWEPTAEEIAIVGELAGVPVPDDLPLGAVIGVMDINGCVEDARSDWAIHGKQHWLLANPTPFPEPRPASGAVGFWYWRPR